MRVGRIVGSHVVARWVGFKVVFSVGVEVKFVCSVGYSDGAYDGDAVGCSVGKFDGS